MHQSAHAMALASPCMSLWQVRSPSRLQLGPTLGARVASIVVSQEPAVRVKKLTGSDAEGPHKKIPVCLKPYENTRTMR